MAAPGDRARAGAARRASASDRFRETGGRRLAVGLAGSLAAHAAVLGLLSVTGAGSPQPVAGSVAVIVLPPPDRPPDPSPPAVRVPPPSPPIRRPAEPVPASGLAAVETEPPEWTPHDVPPRLVNVREVVELLERRWPLAERTGERLVVLWLHVDRAGRVTRLRLRRSSGVPDVDAAASEVASEMKFRPALFRGRPVAVWIAQPIRFAFQVAGGEG